MSTRSVMILDTNSTQQHDSQKNRLLLLYLFEFHPTLIVIFDVHPCLSLTLTHKADYSDLIKVADQVAHEKVNIQVALGP